MRQQSTHTAITRLPASTGKKRIFAFDLDGTVTSVELLPRIARHAGLEKELSELTGRTLRGELAFEESFRKRFAMLRHIPLSLVHESLRSVPLDPHIAAFIQARPGECAIVTGNLDLWVMPILDRLGCRHLASRGAVTANGLALLSVLDKGAAAASLRREAPTLVAIGESMNDVPLFRAASLGIAFAGVHEPVREICRLARFRVPDGKTLCRVLEGL